MDQILEYIQFYLFFMTLMSLVAFILMGYDKFKAKIGGWRISESTFYLLSLLQGYPGILIASKIFRHKTHKTLFQIINFIAYITGLTIIYLLPT